MSAEDEVRQASDQFYAAINRMANGDAGPMMEVWSHSSDVSTMHPLGGREVGWEQVRVPWEQIAAIASNGQISAKDTLIRVVGDLAYEVGVEAGQADFAGQPVSIEQRVTNVYRREAGGWKMVHHHTDTNPELQELVKRLPVQQGQVRS